MKYEVKLSEESKTFIENLRVYLFSSGKNFEEIEEMIEELESHLYESERRGKPIEKIIGKSPKEYMEMISNEMINDYRTWMKYIFLIIIGAFSIKIMSDLSQGTLSYSVLEMTGYLIIAAIFIFTILKGFKSIAVMKQSRWKQIGILLLIVLLPSLLFFGLIFLNNRIDTPVIYFGHISSMIIGVITALFLIGMSLWAKTWLLIVVVSFISLPGFILRQTSFSLETQLLLESVIMFGGIGIYLWLSTKFEKKQA